MHGIAEPADAACPRPRWCVWHAVVAKLHPVAGLNAITMPQSELELERALQSAIDAITKYTELTKTNSMTEHDKKIAADTLNSTALMYRGDIEDLWPDEYQVWKESQSASQST